MSSPIKEESGRTIVAIVPEKKFKGIVADLFLLFLHIEIEGWGLLFEVRYYFGWPGGGRNGQNCPNFIRE